MNLTTDYWQKVGLLVVGAILTVLGTLFVWQWTSADVRYGTGGAYISSTLAISSLGLKNMGHGDAENVTITASFADPLTDISTGQLATPFDIFAGGIGQKAVTGTIKRIVPDEIVNVYFITTPSSPWSNYSQFIQDIKFNRGKGKTGTPWLYEPPSFLLGIVAAGVIIAGLSYWARKIVGPSTIAWSRPSSWELLLGRREYQRSSLTQGLRIFTRHYPFLESPGRIP